MRRFVLLCLALGACDADPDGDALPLDGGTDVGPGEAALPDAGSDASPPDAAEDGAPPDAAPPPRRTVDEDGPFRVGYTVESVTYTDPEGAPRTLRLALWYPTLDEEGTTARYAATITRQGIWDGATPALSAAAPVLVFSHGNSGVAEQSWFLTEFFASHGWVVAAPDHTGNTFNNLSLPTHLLYELRPLDVSAVVDHLDALPAEHPHAGLLAGPVAQAGHSFGGYTTLAVAGAALDVDALERFCEEEDPDPEACAYLVEASDRLRAGWYDDRVAAAIPLTPFASIFGAGVADTVPPTLLVTGGRDETLPPETEADPVWAAMDGPDDRWLDFPEAGHFSFTDFCFVLGDGDGCGADFADVDEVHAATRAFTLAWARAHVEGDDEARAWLDAAMDAGLYTLEAR